MQYLGTIIDVCHAVLMVLWIVGVPLLFWHRYPKLTISYACYAIVFIIVNISSQYFLGECILTTLSKYCWDHYSFSIHENEWFSVRFSKFIFGLAPSHELVKIITGILITISALGGIYFIIFRKKK